MKNYLRVDAEARSLIMDKTFAKYAAIVGSREYDMLQNARAAYPEYNVIRRQIKRNAGKESYKGLTYEYMEAYFDEVNASEEIRREYAKMRLLAECHSIRYPVIKHWFLETFPEVKEFGTDQVKETFTNIADLTAVA